MAKALTGLSLYQTLINTPYFLVFPLLNHNTFKLNFETN